MAVETLSTETKVTFVFNDWFIALNEASSTGQVDTVT